MSKKFAVLAFAAVALGGCVSTGTKVTRDDIAAFMKGITTEQEVLAKLGKPTSSSISASGVRTDSYLYIHASANAANFIPIVGLAAGGASSHTTMVTFIFDADGKLYDYRASQGDSEVHTGLLNQN
jgi:hypothetical protein